MGGNCNIQDLTLPARHSPNHFQSMITEKTFMPWDGLDREEFGKAFNEILYANQDHELKELFGLSLIANFLLASTSPAWVKDFLNQNTHVASLLDFDIGSLKNGEWIRVPIVVSGDSDAKISWFWVGLLNESQGSVHIPKWVLRIVDFQFQDQAKASEELVRSLGPDATGRRFVLFPLSPANDLIQFKGSSAALSFAIAFKSLLTNHSILPDLICTGALDSLGKILPVGMMKKKIETAFNVGFKCFLCPAGGQIVSGNENKGLIPVKTFSQAWTMASLYSGQQDNLLFVFSRALTDPIAFIDKMDSLPADWINSEKHSIRRLFDKIAEESRLADRFTQKFEQMVGAFQLRRAIAISNLIPPEWTDKLINDYPMAALRWCSANLSLCNHLGQIGEANTWQKNGEGLVDQVISLDLRLVADFFNHSLVGAHNRFAFSLELPKALTRVVNFLERQFQLRKDFGCSTDTTLGRLYGTLIQNYGFCGPDNIQQIEALSKKTKQAFGKNLSIELKEQWMRQCDYLTSARLDAGDLEGATTELKSYLEIDRLKEIPGRLESFSCWQISLICRFLARNKEHGIKSIHQAFYTYTLEQFELCHPWQLIFFNLGRVAVHEDKIDRAKNLFEKSLEICRSKHSGPTLSIMVLKPLSFLAHLNQLPSNLDEIELEITMAAGQLNNDHFLFLKKQSFIETLAYVKKNHDKIFPFSYQ